MKPPPGLPRAAQAARLIRGRIAKATDKQLQNYVQTIYDNGGAEEYAVEVNQALRELRGRAWLKKHQPPLI